MFIFLYFLVFLTNGYFLYRFYKYATKKLRLLASQHVHDSKFSGFKNLYTILFIIVQCFFLLLSLYLSDRINKQYHLKIDDHYLSLLLSLIFMVVLYRWVHKKITLLEKDVKEFNVDYEITFRGFGYLQSFLVLGLYSITFLFLIAHIITLFYLIFT